MLRLGTSGVNYASGITPALAVAMASSPSHQSTHVAHQDAHPLVSTAGSANKRI
jgi:hypothetical protein